MFKFQCGNCGDSFSAEPDFMGVVQCPKCQAEMNVYDIDFDLPEGYILGDFEIVRQVGNGSAGKVYLSKQISTGHQVAVKVLNKEYTHNEESLKKFQDEVKLLQQIRHPGIVSAIEAGVQDGIHFFAMDFIDGKPIDHLLTGKKAMPQDKALEYVIEVAKALKYVWQQFQLFHRDIKPENIILTSDGHPVILDLGIALKHGDKTRSGGLTEGSPAYMSPEQACGANLSWTTDLYSLGATLYHMVVGAVPYESSEGLEAVMHMVCSEPFPEPKTRNPHAHVHPEVVKLLKRMMEKAAADRFASWDEFIYSAEIVLELLRNPKAAHRSPAKRNLFVQKEKKGSAVGLVYLSILILFLAGLVVVLVLKSTGDARKRLDNLTELMKNADKSRDHCRQLVAGMKLAKEKLDGTFLNREVNYQLKLKLREAEECRMQAEEKLDILEQQIALENKRKARIYDQISKAERKALNLVTLIHRSKTSYLLTARNGEAHGKLKAEIDGLFSLYMSFFDKDGANYVAEETMRKRLEKTTQPRLKEISQFRKELDLAFEIGRQERANGEK